MTRDLVTDARVALAVAHSRDTEDDLQPLRPEVLAAATDLWGRAPAELPDLRLALARGWGPRGWYRELDLSVPRMGMTIDQARGLDHMWEQGALRLASLWWVAPDMVELASVAVPSVPGDLTAREVPLPTPCGLVVYAGTVPGLDARTGERTVSTHAILWAPAMVPSADRRRTLPCIRVSTYRRLIVHDASVGENGAGMVMLAPEAVMADPLTDGCPPDGVVVWMPLGRSDWPLDDTVDEQSFATEHTEVQSFSASDDRRILAATLTLAQQPLTDLSPGHNPGRPASRRAERAGVPQEVARQPIRVVTLRRRALDGTEDHASAEHVEHDHRWTVSGHWRLAAVGPGRAERRLTWVRPHIKGPEGAPLKVPDQVNAWRR